MNWLFELDKIQPIADAIGMIALVCILCMALVDLSDRFGIAVTRVARTDIEKLAVSGLRFQFGDMMNIVGREKDLEKAATTVGNSLKELNQTQLLSFFIAIVLVVAMGTMPIMIPGLPQPIRLTLAGARDTE